MPEAEIRVMCFENGAWSHNLRTLGWPLVDEKGRDERDPILLVS